MPASSMEAALDRVGRELGDSYPSLAANIHMANLEIRAGRTMTEALEHLGDRLGLDEARSFATLIQQSDELGSSISDALRVYSDDMRHKRLSRAEEKAYSLPAKLAVPMMVCIFPVLFVVILCPVIVRRRDRHVVRRVLSSPACGGGGERKRARRGNCSTASVRACSALRPQAPSHPSPARGARALSKVP